MRSSVIIRNATIEDIGPISDLLAHLEAVQMGTRPVCCEGAATDGTGAAIVGDGSVGPVQQANGVRYQPMEWVNGA